MLKRIIFGALLILAPLRSDALTGMDLLHMSNGGEYKGMLFNYYVIGFVDAYGLSNALTVADWKAENQNFLSKKLVTQPRYRLCINENQTYEQLGLVIRKYLSDNPRELHKDAGVLAAKALEAAFPCK